MASIDTVIAREILDSRGNPTVEVEVLLDDDSVGRAAVPSGRLDRRLRGRRAARRRQALRRQGHREGRQRRAGPDRARDHRPRRAATSASSTRRCSTSTAPPTRPTSGANAILGVSLAVARAASVSAGLPLFRYVGGPNAHLLPVPMMNILNGGAHADTNVDIQEFMIAPIGAASFREALQQGAEVYHALKAVLKKKGLATGVGDEGGFAPELPSNRAALDLIAEADQAGRLQARHRLRARPRRGGQRVLREEEVRLRGQEEVLRRRWSTTTPTWCRPTPSSRSRTRSTRTTGTAGRR